MALERRLTCSKSEPGDRFGLRFGFPAWWDPELSVFPYLYQAEKCICSELTRGGAEPKEDSLWGRLRGVRGRPGGDNGQGNSERCIFNFKDSSLETRHDGASTAFLSKQIYLISPLCWALH